MEKILDVNGKAYEIIKLLGKGKGGYSYLAKIGKQEVVVKQIHHEPCSYYQFGNKLEAELSDYKRLQEIEFELFSHFEVTAGIPTVLFAITTWKESGQPNVCFHSWSCFHGDKTAFFAVMGNLYQHTHPTCPWPLSSALILFPAENPHDKRMNE